MALATPTNLQEAEAQLSAIRAALARKSLLPFTTYTRSDYEVNWHHKYLASRLDAVEQGKLKRLMVFMPPQNGKTELVSRRFPAYALGKNPDRRIIAASYADTLAQDISRDVQKIITSAEYRELFPHVRLAEGKDIEKRTQGQFDIVGYRGYYIGTGINSGITGRTLDIGILDDPIKNRAEAESEVYRDRVWENYKSAFTTRQFGSDAALIICLTRWNEDDIAGRLLKLAKEHPDAEQWEVIELPAICDAIRVYDPRTIGQALWPKKYPLSWLRTRKAISGAYDWAALYQQQPIPEGGGLVKREWFKFVNAAPVLARRARGWDTASKEDGGDYTVGVKISEAVKVNLDESREPSGLFYIEHVVRDQLTPYGVDQLMQVTAQLDGVECAQREEKEPGSSGQAVVDARTKTLNAFDYKEVPTTGNKRVRSKPFRNQLEAGNVFIVRTGDPDRDAWIEPYIDELTKFPTGAHDDQMDGSSCAYNAVLLEPVPEDDFVSFSLRGAA